ncbi:LicD family protein [Alkalibacter sp. M17DMB]|nr:LicD family protein [Alkalibacter mobilis]
MEKIDIKTLQRMQIETLKEVDRICGKNSITYYFIGGSLIGAVRHKGFIPWDDDIDIAMMRPDYEKFTEICKEELSEKYFLQTYETDRFFYQSMARICILGTFIDEKYSEHLKFNKSVYFDIFPLDKIPEDKEEQKKHANAIRRIDKLIFLKSCYIYDRGFLNYKLIGKKIVQKILNPISFPFLMDKREKIIRQFEDSNSELVCSTASRYSYEKQIHEASRFGKPYYMDFEGEKYPAPADWEGYLKQLYGDYMKLPPEEKRKPEHDAYFL